MGILVSLTSKKIIKFFKNEINTILVACGFFIFVTIFLTNNDIIYLFLLLFLFCIGMFTAHTVSTQLANSMKSSQKSLTSGMYLTFYYLGGAMGSFLPTIIYKNFGWDFMIYLFALILVVVEVVGFINKKLF